MKKHIIHILLVMGCILATVGSASGQELDNYKYQFGVRGGMTLADGEPANDLITYGIYGRYNLNDLWNIGLSVDFLTGDFEEPNALLGISSIELKNDAAMSNVVVTLWGEREFNFSSEKFQRLKPYAALGLGIGIPSVDDIKGSVNPVGSYNITTDPGTEFVPAFALGLRYILGKNWETELTALYSYHVADWEVKDTISGKISSLDSYSTYGFYLGLGYRF